MGTGGQPNNSINTINIETEKIKGEDKINSIKSTISINGPNGPIDYYIVCLNCKCRSPHIEKINFDCNLMDINVSYYCACLPKCNNSQNEFLEKLISSTKPLNLCPIHSNNTLKFYCNICKTFFCEKCQKDSEKHIEDLINFDIIMSLEIAEQIKNLLKKTKNKDVYNKIIDNYLNDLKKFNIPKYHLKRTIKLHDSITAIVLLQSGSIAIGSYDKTICIWNIKESFYDKKIKVLGKVLSLLEFKPNMLLSSQESIICLYNINSDKDECIYTFKGHELWVNCLIKYDDKTFASASNDHKIIIWDYEQRKKINEFEVYKNSIFSLIKLNDGNLCFGGADSEIRIFDWKKGRIINKLKGHSGWIMCLSPKRCSFCCIITRLIRSARNTPPMTIIWMSSTQKSGSALRRRMCCFMTIRPGCMNTCSNTGSAMNTGNTQPRRESLTMSSTFSPRTSRRAARPMMT